LTSTTQPTSKQQSNSTPQPISTPQSNVRISEATISGIGLPKTQEHEDIQTFLEKVQNREIDFWNPNIQRAITKEQRLFLDQPVNYGLFLCFALDGAEIHHKILRRFARVVVFNLTRQKHSAASLTQALQEVGLLIKAPSEAEKTVEGYIDAGSRYNYIAHELGGLAALFFLPLGVGNSL
jgi:hypothetical protein